MLLLAGILITVAAALFVLYPLLARESAALTDGPDQVAELRELYSLRDVTYETLRDLEFDFHAGKIDEADFRELGDRFRREAVDVVQRIDALEAAVPAPPSRRRNPR